MPMQNPPQPGDFIRAETVELAGLSVSVAVAAIQVSRPSLFSLLDSKADLPGDMALLESVRREDGSYCECKYPMTRS